MTRLGSLSAFGAFGVFWGAWAVLLPAIKEQTGASVAELGVALVFVAAAALPAMFATGLLLDRLGPRVLPISAVLFGLAVLLPGLADSVWQLVLALVVVGAASGALDVSINFGATSIEACGGAPIMQKAHASFSGGFLAGSLFAAVAREIGVDPVVILLATSLVPFLSAWLNREALGLPPPAEKRAPRISLSRPLLILGLLCGTAFVVESGIEQWSALFLESELDASPVFAGLGPAFFAAAMVTGRVLGHGLGIRFGDRRLLAGGALVSACGLALAATSTAVPVALVGFFLGGGGISVAAPVLLGAAGRGSSERERGSAVASVTTVSYLGFLAGPPLIGVVSGAFDLRAGVALLAGIAALTSIAASSLGGDALPLRRLQHPPRGVVS
ncbi:MAG TPA: MFS transporter [Gaiellaceae bacterium]|nr:MFS transporter [Gaiellaceae bacterium]